jgi:hypothetical protein
MDDARHHAPALLEQASPRIPWIELAVILAIFGLASVQGYRMLRTSEAPVAYEAGKLIAAGDLEDALYEPRGSRPIGGFTVSDGSDGCRKFTNGSVSGLACSYNGEWRIKEMRQAGR